MRREHSKYDEDSNVCFECIQDHGLRELVKSEGEKNKCSLCGKERESLTIKQLAKVIDPVFREYYDHGEMESRMGSGDDDTIYEAQAGEDLTYVLQEFIGDLLDCQDELIDALIDLEKYDPRDGDIRFYSQEINYEKRSAAEFAPYEDWLAIADEVKTRKRFFSDSARKFFEWLFEDLEKLSSTYKEAKEIQVDFSGAQPGPSTVIQEWPIKTALYRGRRGDTKDEYIKLLGSTERELSPPPSRYAKAGRMNPDGVSVFYGALDVETCLAEMRSSIGGHIVVAEFQTTKPLRLVDFRRLERAWGGKESSYFQSDYKAQAGRSHFLRRLHRLISQPIIPGHESDYLITQVLAEYLGHVREKNFDGLLFTSTQRKGGTNIVLFPKRYSDEDKMLERFSLRVAKKTAKLYRTRGIEYDMEELKYVSLRGGEIHVYSLHGDDDD